MKKDGQKKFVRYKEGAEMYSMSMRKFQDMAKDAGAIYKVGKMANCLKCTWRHLEFRKHT